MWRLILGRPLLLGIQYALTSVALIGIGFLQIRIDRDSFVEHKTIAVVMISTALFEILQDAAVQLVDLLKPLLFHQRTSFLAADTAGAKHHQRFLFHLVG